MHNSMKQIYALIVMLMMASVAFTGCVSDDSDDATDTTTDTTTDDTTTDDSTTDDSTTDDSTTDDTIAPVGADTQSTLDVIMERGKLKCGIKTSQYGMGYLDSDTGVYSGLDVEYCRAIAAAIGLDPAADIEFIVASAGDRFTKLEDKEIDVLIRTTTWTTSRDADLNADFAGINFYDGQGMLVNTEAHSGANSISALDGANICTTTGTTTEGNLADYFAANGLTFTVVGVDGDSAAMEKFKAQDCTAWTGDMSNMVAQQYAVSQDDNIDFTMDIMPELLSKEPLGAATRDNDDDWNDVVQWVWFGMLTAEEMNITSGNYANADLEDTATGRLLNNNLGLGTEANPLPATWMQNVLQHVGNYQEAYDNSFCDGTSNGERGNTLSNCLVNRAGTMNAPYWDGGLQYAPPMR